MDKKTSAKIINGMAEKIELLDDKLRQVQKNEARKRLDLFESFGARIEVLENNEALNLNRIESLEDNIDSSSLLQRFDTINEKIEVLENKYKYKIQVLYARNQKRADHIKTLNGRIEVLEDMMKNPHNNWFNASINGKIEALDERINNRCDYIDKHNRVHFDKLGAKVEDLHSGIKIIKEMQKITKSKCDKLAKVDSNTLECIDNINYNHNSVEKNLNERCDDLEAKNYQIKSDLDKLSNGDKTDDIVINRDDINDLEARQTEEQEIWLDENEDIFNETMKEGRETIKRVKARKGENNE